MEPWATNEHVLTISLAINRDNVKLKTDVSEIFFVINVGVNELCCWYLYSLSKQCLFLFVWYVVGGWSQTVGSPASDLSPCCLTRCLCCQIIFLSVFSYASLYLLSISLVYTGQSALINCFCNSILCSVWTFPLCSYRPDVILFLLLFDNSVHVTWCLG